jgi:hypothetical protein
VGQAGVATNILGSLAVTQTATITGATTMSTASSTGLVKANSLNVGGSGTNVNSIVFGYCTITGAPSITASSTAFVVCSGATNITSAFEVFVQATSSLTSNLIIQSASSTPTAGSISLQIYNLGYNGAQTPPATSVNFIGIR